ncbi:MAG: hypothetical protein KDD62_00945 [Bdellovibrionales bacterium]|nr:hypothetical protein [Bdellovibrionales bacterium]
MGKVEASSVATLAASTSTSTFPPVESITWRTYVDPGGRFQISYPNEWVLVQPEKEQNRVYFINLSLGDDINSGGISVAILGQVSDLVRLAKKNERFTIETSNAVDLRSIITTTVNLDGHYGLGHLNSYMYQGHSIEQRAVYLTTTDHTFVITLIARAERLSQYMPIYEETVRTFSLGE